MARGTAPMPATSCCRDAEASRSLVRRIRSPRPARFLTPGRWLQSLPRPSPASSASSASFLAFAGPDSSCLRLVQVAPASDGKCRADKPEFYTYGIDPNTDAVTGKKYYSGRETNEAGTHVKFLSKEDPTTHAWVSYATERALAAAVATAFNDQKVRPAAIDPTPNLPILDSNIGLQYWRPILASNIGARPCL